MIKCTVTHTSVGLALYRDASVSKSFWGRTGRRRTSLKTPTVISKVMPKLTCSICRYRGGFPHTPAQDNCGKAGSGDRLWSLALEVEMTR